MPFKETELELHVKDRENGAMLGFVELCHILKFRKPNRKRKHVNVSHLFVPPPTRNFCVDRRGHEQCEECRRTGYPEQNPPDRLWWEQVYTKHSTHGAAQHYYYYGSTALCWALTAFQFLDPIHSR
jgi:hypothetical protein